MKVRVTFNDGKTFSHYAFVVFRIGLNITYVCSGVLMFALMFMNLVNDSLEEKIPSPEDNQEPQDDIETGFIEEYDYIN